MMSVQAEQLPSPMQSSELQQEPSFAELQAMPLKQQTKRKVLTPLNILIILSSLALLGIGSYYLYSLSAGTEAKSQITASHDKIISYADSSSQNGGSNSGSTTSKGSSNNNRPNAKANPAGKNVISSNQKLNGGSSSGSPGDDEDSEEDNNSEKRKSSQGSSTVVDSDDEESSEEASDENTEQVVWVDTKAPEGANAGAPMVGSARNGG